MIDKRRIEIRVCDFCHSEENNDIDTRCYDIKMKDDSIKQLCDSCIWAINKHLEHGSE